MIKLSQVTHQGSLAYKAEIEDTLIHGFPPLGSPRRKGAIVVAAERLGVDKRHLQKWVLKHEADQYTPDWSLYNKETTPPSADKDDILMVATKQSFPDRRVFLITAAQDDTAVHMPFWNNLLMYADYKDAEVLVGGFTYQKGLFEDHMVQSALFAEEVRPYLNGNVIDLGPNIQFYGRANILPTTADPLAGWDTNSRRKSMILPHARIAYKSIPVAAGSMRKQVLSTGVVTVPNYVQRNAGQKAEFHHTIGATIVEISPIGVHFVRQIHAADDGSFQDLDVIVGDGVLTTGNSVESITFGDAHRYVLDRDVALASWGFDTDIDDIVNSTNMLDVLKPKSQFIHDSFDFYSRSHHTRFDPVERQRRFGRSIDSVQFEIKQASDFLGAIRRSFCDTVHVFSNHNTHLDKWLNDRSVIDDAQNAPYWHYLNYKRLLHAREHPNNPLIIHAAALRLESGDTLTNVKFLREGESYKICDDIECGYHGHKGSGGARGSVANFAKFVDRVNIADKHSPAIKEGVYCAGTSSELELDYNQGGPSAWDHTHTITYKNSRRTLVTIRGDKWRG